MQFSGEEQFPLAPAELWHRLVDPAFIARHMPGLKKIERTDPELVVCRVQPRFSFISAPMTITVAIADKQAPNRARMQITGKGVAMGLTVETAIELHESNGGSTLAWTGEVKQINGLLKGVSQGLLEGAARKVIADGWAGIRRDLEQASNSKS
jgi:carbon monoxide dehydrogenase subunit G